MPFISTARQAACKNKVIAGAGGSPVHLIRADGSIKEVVIERVAVSTCPEKALSGVPGRSLQRMQQEWLTLQIS
jgi:hypothetical protein